MAGSDIRGLLDGMGRMANAGFSGRRAAATAWRWQWQWPAGALRGRTVGGVCVGIALAVARMALQECTFLPFLCAAH